MTRIFLDTNVYIIGAQNRHSAEGQILTWLGFRGERENDAIIVASEELLSQIVRVAKRIRNKDWSGKLLNLIWTNLNLQCEVLDSESLNKIEQEGIIPREDAGVYLTAKIGAAEYFVSANHKLIRSLVQETGEFKCFTPEKFVSEYIKRDRIQQ